MTIKLDIGIKGIKKSVKRLAKNHSKIGKAASRTANRTFRKMNTDGKKEATKLFTITSGKIQKASNVINTTPSNLSKGKLEYEATRVNLKDFKAKSKKRGKGRAHGGITYEVLKGKVKTIQHGWIWHSHPNKIALSRTSKASQKTKGLTGPDIAQIMSNKKVTKVITDTRDKFFTKEYGRLIQRAGL
jgi:hypothetical protein